MRRKRHPLRGAIVIVLVFAFFVLLIAGVI